MNAEHDRFGFADARAVKARTASSIAKADAHELRAALAAWPREVHALAVAGALPAPLRLRWEQDSA